MTTETEWVEPDGSGWRTAGTMRVEAGKSRTSSAVIWATARL
jgi:hypothetical protein